MNCCNCSRPIDYNKSQPTNSQMEDYWQSCQECGGAICEACSPNCATPKGAVCEACQKPKHFNN